MERLTEKMINGEYSPKTYFDKGIRSYVDNIDEIFNKLGYLEDLEEQGRLIQLPCTLGSDIYFIKAPLSYYKVPLKETFDRVSIFKSAGNIDIICRTENRTFSKKHLGDTVFLTIEDAQNKLEELTNAK